MAPQTPSPTSPASGPSTAMFHKSPGGNIKRSELWNGARDMFKIVFNNYASGTGQAAGTGKEVENKFHDVLDKLLKIIPPFLEEVGKNQSRSSVSKSSGADGTGLPPQGVTTDPTPQSPIAEGYSVDMNDIKPSESSSLPVSSITPHAPQSFTLEDDLAHVSKLELSKPSLPVTCIADGYARSMLKCLHGYPLYEPEPFSELSKEYPRSGVHIGDVGFVRGDGAFDFLFNICRPPDGLINPSDLSDDFYLKKPNHSATRPMAPLPPKTYIFRSPITRTDSGKYSCEASEGAILELPEGAIQDEAINTDPFEKLAARLGVQWYDYTMNRGRKIPNGSLYLITSFTKCTQWGIAMFNQPCTPGQGLRFGSKASFPFGKPSPKYYWKGSGAFTTKVTKPNQTDTLNQCVFLRGYKIMIRQDIFDNLCNRSLKRGPAQRIRGGGGTDFISRTFTRTPTKTSNVTQLDEVVLHADFNSSLVHPSDLINAALLSQNPSAQVALTHDDVWCDLLCDDFPKPNHGTLINIARLYSSTVDEYGCVSLEKISDPSNDESCSVQGIGALQPKRSSTSDEKYIPVPDETSMPIDQEKNNNMCCAIVYKIYGDVAIFEFGDGHYTEQERGMIRDHLSNTVTFKLIDYNDVMKTMKKHSLAQSILDLPNPQAAYSNDQIKKKHGLCSNGTRVALLQEMADWVTGTEETRIYVLSGPIGIGKTMVAYTVAARTDDLGLLGASLFSRGTSEPFAKAIEAALLTKPDPDTMDPREQLEALILEPVRNIVRSRVRPILIVVDALDVCGEEDVLSVLTGLSQLVRELPCFKVILTKRPHRHLDYFFHSQDGHQIFHLQNMEDNVNDAAHPSLQEARKQSQDRTEAGHASDTRTESLVQTMEKLIITTDLPSIPFSENFNPGNSATIERGDLDNSDRDTDIKSPELRDVIDTHLKAEPSSLSEIRKNDQTQFTVSETAATGDSGWLSTDDTLQSTGKSRLAYITDILMPSDPSKLVNITDIVPSDPSTLPIIGIPGRYARSMLNCFHGYPLYNPRPFSDLSMEYLRNGVNVGDVGFVREDGTFDFLFNICPSRSGLINPPDLPVGFSLDTSKHRGTRAMPRIPRNTSVFQGPVVRTRSGKYMCSESEGAILELPEGAIEEEAIDLYPFKELAERFGVQWHEYVMHHRGRDISNGSLSLITSVTKCTQWGIAVFLQPSTPGQGLKFSKQRFPFFGNPTPKYYWKNPGSTFAVTKVADQGKGDVPNQCVFIRGYKIIIREDIYNILCRRGYDLGTPSLPPQAGSSNPIRHPAQRIRGG